MAVFNYAKKEIDAKIVYYGPAISGKTTNLQYIHQHMKPDQRGKMVSLATNEDRTLFFDFLPIELESVRGFKTRFHLYTVPGQVYYGATRRAVLTGADGVVFVADSHGERMEENLASFKDLEDNLRYYGKKIETTPLVIQYNKRDLPDVLGVEELNQKINKLESPHFESVAILGKGVFETLTMACRLVLKAIENGVESRRSSQGAEKSPAPGAKSLRSEKAAVQGVQARPAGTPDRPPVPEKEAPKSKVQAVEPLRPKQVRQEKDVAVSLSPPIVKAAPALPERTEDEKKTVPAVKGPEKKRPELSFKAEKGAGKKALGGKGNLRILSCGEPRVSSPTVLEIPLSLEFQTTDQSFPLQVSLSINLEQAEPRVE
jgi:hypothetical protein